jgi:hypothetical protein
MHFEQQTYVFWGIWMMLVAVRGLTFATPRFVKSDVFSENWAVVSGTRIQRCTNPGHQVARATEFCSVAPNVLKSLEWNLVRVTLLALRVLRWLLDFWNIWVLLAYIHGLCVKWTCLRVPCNLKVLYVFLNVFHTTGMYTPSEKLQTPACSIWNVLLVQLF